jgi:hypothetical protein
MHDEISRAFAFNAESGMDADQGADPNRNPAGPRSAAIKR